MTATADPSEPADPIPGSVVDRRLAPRPLALHLGVAGLIPTTSDESWQLLRNASGAWSDGWTAPWTLDGTTPDPGTSPRDEPSDPEAALRGLGRAHAFLDGLEAYRRHPYRRALAPPPVLWREGSSRLLDHRQAPLASTGDEARSNRPAVFVVPSLVNRAYVLDLREDSSFVRYLASRGLDPLLLDWGMPGAAEAGFGLTEYIAGRLEAALDAAAAETAGRRLHLIGYCMGGLLALAGALRRPDRVASLTLLATPWDFKAGQHPALAFGLLPRPVVEGWLGGFGVLPIDVMQALFAALDPLATLRKFAHFGRLDPSGPAARGFVALEDWVNDGVVMAAGVARESLHGWYAENLAARGAWRIAGRAVDPAGLRCPALVVVPRQDRIVPPDSARALAAALPEAEVLELAIGHVGMMASGRARRTVWEPVAEWILSGRQTCAP